MTTMSDWNFRLNEGKLSTKRSQMSARYVEQRLFCSFYLKETLRALYISPRSTDFSLGNMLPRERVNDCMAALLWNNLWSFV